MRRQSADKRNFISIIIPTLNEEYAIGQVLSLIPYRELEPVEVIVIDGGSSDGTVEIAKYLGASVKKQTKPGYNRAVIEALSYAKGDILVFLDGDGVYDPREIPKLLRVMKEENADLVVGSRFRGEIKPGAIPKLRLLGNKLMNLLFTLLLGTRITDAFSGFIIAKKTAVANLEKLFEPVPEPVQYAMIAEVHLRQGKVVEAPIMFYPRIGKYKMSPILRGFKILLTIIKHSFMGGQFS